MTNKYAIFTSDDDENDNNENDDLIRQTGDVKRAPETGITQAMTSTGVEGSTNDVGNDNAGMPPVTVTSHPTSHTVNELNTVLDLGSLANKHQPDFDMFDDDVSQVTVATKNSVEGKSNAPQIPNSHTKPKKSHKYKNKTKRNQHDGRRSENKQQVVMRHWVAVKAVTKVIHLKKSLRVIIVVPMVTIIVMHTRGVT